MYVDNIAAFTSSDSWQGGSTGFGLTTWEQAGWNEARRQLLGKVADIVGRLRRERTTRFPDGSCGPASNMELDEVKQASPLHCIPVGTGMRAERQGPVRTRCSLWRGDSRHGRANKHEFPSRKGPHEGTDRSKNILAGNRRSW